MSLNHFLHIFFPIYLATYFCLCLLSRTLIVWRKIKTNPLGLGKKGGIYDFIWASLWGILTLEVSSVFIFVFSQDLYHYLGPVAYLDTPTLQKMGVFLMLTSMFWVFTGQAQMGNSWRIGIDQKNKTELVRTGFYRFSRNPIFLGILVSALGVFLTLPNLITFFVMGASFLVIQMEIRLEEAHLAALHGKSYEDFCKKVRRWV